MLPPSAVSRPALFRTCAISAAVVDLPLVPVIATTRAPEPSRSRSRKNNSVSPMISTPAACASATVQCGAGCVNGTPGDRTRAETPLQSTSRRSATSRPSDAAVSLAASASSHVSTRALPARKARAAAIPLRPRPNRATVFPANTWTGIMTAILAQFERRQPYHRQHDRNDPETDHDRRLLPALLLEVVVQRRHSKNPLSGEPE